MPKLREMVNRIIKEELRRKRLTEDDYWGDRNKKDPSPDLEKLEQIVEQFVDDQIGLDSASGYVRDEGETIHVSFKHPVESWAEDNQQMIDELINILSIEGFEGYREGNSFKSGFWLTK